MNRQIYGIIGIVFLIITGLIVILQIEKNNVINEIVQSNNLTGKYDFISQIGQLAFNYDTGNYIITESEPQEGSMVMLALSNKSGGKIGNIGVFHNGGHSQTPRDGFWGDEARSIAMTQKLSGICLEMPPGLRDYCVETKNSNNIFYAVVDGLYRKKGDQTEYTKKQRYLQNPFSEFAGILLTTEEVGLQYSGLLQSIVDSITFFDTEKSDKKTYYGDGITFQYPSEANHIRRASGFDEISFLSGDSSLWDFRVVYNKISCKDFFNNNRVYKSFTETYDSFYIIKAFGKGLSEGNSYVWCIEGVNENIFLTSDTSLEELIYNIEIK